MYDKNKTLIVIVGPTAVGKTKAAIEVAEYFDTEIISADSRQFFKELKIGVASPSKSELNRVKHHFIANKSIHDYYNVYKYENEALDLISILFEKHDFIVLTGGSGLYVDAVCKGIDELPDPDETLRNELLAKFKENGIEYLRQQLKILDEEYYYSVDLANHKRLLRAIEVCLTTGKTFSSLRKNTFKTRPFNIIKIGLNMERTILYERINTRVDNMIENGLINEVENLLPFKHLNALNTVGYKELFEYFDGKVKIEEATENIKTHTRRYAKRQLTWFFRDKDIKWIDIKANDNIIPDVLSTIPK
jgi:tRNA dimethylallyltransferase